METRPHGFDNNHWNGNFRTPKYPPRAIDFSIQKLSEATQLDAAYFTLKDQMRDIPIRGGYHYFRGQWPWEAQMDVFLKALDGYDFWALDVEKGYNYAGPMIRGSNPFNKPFAGFVESVPLALNYLKENSNKPGLIYTGAGMWADWLLPIQKELLPYDLWVAHWQNIRNPEAIANYFTIKGAETMREDWRFWQYDQNGMGGRGKEFGVDSLGLDLNVFNGTLKQLHAWAKPETAPAMTWEQSITIWARGLGYDGLDPIT